MESGKESDLLREVRMPKLSLTMEEGTIARWLKNSGDFVQRGETMLEVESDKATMQVESEFSGILKQIVVPAGATSKVDTLIAYIEEKES
jgi:pyruvate/2-oxoglutarate dehydrogenase complex dihydrolipoamide acyltransferase (E2) component